MIGPTEGQGIIVFRAANASCGGAARLIKVPQGRATAKTFKTLINHQV